jgi:hypothetical protein
VAASWTDEWPSASQWLLCKLCCFRCANVWLTCTFAKLCGASILMAPLILEFWYLWCTRFCALCHCTACECQVTVSAVTGLWAGQSWLWLLGEAWDFLQNTGPQWPPLTHTLAPVATTYPHPQPQWPPLTHTLGPSGHHLPQSIQYYPSIYAEVSHVFSFHVSPPKPKPCIHFSSPTKLLQCPNLNPCITFSVCTNCEADYCISASQGN